MDVASPKNRNLGIVLLSLGVLLWSLSYSWAEQAIRVGVYDFDPMISTPRDGKPRGLFIDILEYVAEKEGWRIEYVPGTWDECLRRVQSGKIDLLPSIGYSEERTAILDFTNEYLFLDWGVVYRKKGSPIRSILELAGKRIGALKGSIYTEGFRNLLDRFDLKAHIVEKDNYRQICKAIEDGEVDVGINAQVFGLLLEQDYRIEATDILFSPVKIGFAAPKNTGKKILQSLDTHISELKADRNSYYYQRFRHWTGLFAKKEVFPLWLKNVLPIVVVLLVVAITFAVVLRKKVAAKTSELSTAHEALSKSQSLLNNIIEQSPFSMWISDAGGTLRRINPACRRWTRLTEEEVVGKYNVLKDEAVEAQGIMPLVQSVFREGRTANFELTWESSFLKHIEHAESTKLILDVTIFPVKDHEGAITNAVCQHIDITDRKKAEEERQKFVMLAESSSEFIGMCDLDLQPLYVNPAGVRMVGLPDMAAACRVKVQDYFFLEDQQFITEEFFPRVLRDGHGVVEIRLRHFQTGEPVWMSYYLFHLCDPGGKVVGWATVSRDITESKKAQEEISRLNAELEQRVLERTAELEAANKELESFSYSVSHDLRAPLRAISGFAQILATDYPAQLDDRGRHYLNNVVDASAHMDRLIVDLLAYSRVGRRSVGHEPIELKGLLAQIARTMADQFAAVNASLTIQDNIPEVIGDETLLNQIFTNLIVNALTYRRPEVPLRVDVTCNVEDSAATVRVSDNGIGIRPEYLQKIFNIFQRLHSQDAYPGTGIGLAIVKKSVALLGGQVSVESVPGQGSTFSVKLLLAL